MGKLESKTLDQILEVIRLSKNNYLAGFSIETAYREAIQKVADEYSVAYQTIGDGCRRRLGLSNMGEFNKLIKDHVNGNSVKLMELLETHTDSLKHDKIKRFFLDEGQAKEASIKITDRHDNAELKQEAITFRLDRESVRKLKALAELEGLSVAAWLAGMTKRIVDEKLKEWAAGFVSKK